MNEVSLVLKSICILISSLKEAQNSPTAKGNHLRETISEVHFITLKNTCLPLQVFLLYVQWTRICGLM